MTEILTIKKFGPIDDIKLEIKAINLFIGDQGTGKSTVAKLYSLIQNYIDLIIFNPHNPSLEKDENWQFHEYFELFEIRRFLNEKTEIYYFDETRNIVIDYKEGVVSINFERKLTIPPLFNYIVAERAFVSTLSDAFFGLNQFGTKLPTLFNRFGNKYSTARKEKVRRDYKSVLNIDFSHINGVDSVILNDGVVIQMSDASTGLQGTIPLLVVFDDIVEDISSEGPIPAKHTQNLLVIEEPELNLFPFTQKKLVEYLVLHNFRKHEKQVMSELKLDIYRNVKNKLLITTHSPYILTAFNNLIYAYSVGRSNFEAVSEIITSKCWIDPSGVAAFLLNNGKAEDIFDREENLIKAHKIDEVSTLLNNEFDRLLNIDFKEKA
jgi:predicted ATP-dependent endonuclease of OLD family